MRETEQNKWDLMAKVLADEASSSERDVLETWINLDEENKRMFNSSEKDWNAVEFQNHKNKIDVNAAWEKQFQRLQNSRGIESNLKSINKTNYFLKVAASILIIAGLGIGGFYFFTNNSNKLLTVTTGSTESKTIVLPDGSEITLNDNSSLIYPKHFNEETREVKLTGEAFFDISRNAAKPFIIHTNKADVKVLGTSFNVNTSLTDDLIEVFVYTGVVQLTDGKNPEHTMIIEQGHVGRLDNQILEKQVNSDKNYLAWKTKELFFKDIYLNDITKTLSKVYDVNIELSDPKIGECLYTSTNSTFVKEDLKDILNIICSTFNLEFEKKNNKYLIKGEGC